MKLYNYFSSKSIGQRIRLIIAFVALLTFCFFIIKGNIFDKKTDTPNQATSQTEIIEVTTSEATAEVTQTPNRQVFTSALLMWEYLLPLSQLTLSTNYANENARGDNP